MSEAFVPYAPTPHPQQHGAKLSPWALVRTLRILSRNPLEVWAEHHYEEPFVRTEVMGRRIVILNDPDAIHHCLVQNAQNYRLDFMRQAVLRPFLRDGLLTTEGEQWKRVRRLTAPLFSPRHVHGFASAMVGVCDDFVQQLDRKAGSVISVGDEMVQLTLAHLSATLFAGDMDLDPEILAQSVDELMAIGGRPHLFDLARLPSSVPRIGRGRAHKIIAALRGLVSDLTTTRREQIADGANVPEDLLTLLVRAEDEEGERLSDDEIVDNVMTFIAAGHETTARSLSWTLYLVSQCNDVRDALETEVSEARLNELPAEDWLGALPYTEAVLKESMRLYPPAAVISRRSIEEDRFADCVIPADSTIFVSPWLVHRHRRLWKNSQSFDPSRFMNGEPAHKYAYLPFGLGPRVCIGARFAMQEAVISLAKLIEAFRFKYTLAVPPKPNMRITTFPNNELPMEITRRERAGRSV